MGKQLQRVVPGAAPCPPPRTGQGQGSDPRTGCVGGSDVSAGAKEKGRVRHPRPPPRVGPAQLTLLLQSAHSCELLASGENQSILRATGINLTQEYEKIAKEWFYIARPVL